MLRKLVNQVEIEIKLQPAEPLLIASGVPNASGVDLPFVLTYRGGDIGEPYLPGSSLKGVLRSHAERISRSIASRAKVCDPHYHKQVGPRDDLFCGKRLQPRRTDHNADVPDLKSHEIYQQSCPICRTFGSTLYRGRFSVGDAYLEPGVRPRIERRDGVGIDRFSGGASRGVKFEMEVLTQGVFQTRLRLENFEDWQLGLMALLCRDLEDELVTIGHATTRGLGLLKGDIQRFDVLYIVPPGRELDHDRVYGVGSLLEHAEGRLYGYVSDDDFKLANPPEPSKRSFRRVQSFVTTRGEKAQHETARLRDFFDDAIARWAERMDKWGTA